MTDSGPPYRRIAAEIAGRITRGELRPGTRVPSTRQIIGEYGVAMATASKVLAALRADGLVVTRPGHGTVVAEGTRRPPAAGPATPEPALRDRMVAAAITVADAEGIGALSMRRLAGELGVATMSLYRHVADKEELLLLMMDTVFARYPLPRPAAPGWRAELEAVARLQWSMYRRHLWLAQAVSFTRPLPAPNAMVHTEAGLRALDGHGLDPVAQFLAAVTVANYVRGTAVNLDAEAHAEQETGITEREWMRTQQARVATAIESGRLPLMARYLRMPDLDFSVERLFEFGLQRLLDGLAPIIEAGGGRS